MKRYYVSDIGNDLLMSNLKNKSVIDTFGRYFNKESEANKFMLLNNFNSKYLIETEGRKIISLERLD